MYKGKKYNFMVVGLIFIMAFVVGISAGMTSTTVDVNAGVEDAIESEIQEVNVEDIQIEGAVAPGSSATAFERLEYAFTVYDQIEGRKSLVSQTLTTYGTTQYMKFSKLRGGELDFTEEYFNMPVELFGLGKNEVKLTYSNGTDMHMKTIDDTSKFDYEKMTYNASASGEEKSFSVYDYTVTQNRSPINDFFITINDDTSTVVTYDSKARGKDYYTVTVSLNTSKVDSSYLETFYANGTKSVDFDSIIFTFEIYKETGLFKTIQKNETFYANYGSYGANVTVVYKETVLEYSSSTQAKAIENQIAEKATALGW